MTIDRTAAAKALAKTIAYLACGKRDEARQWFRALACELTMVHLLKD